MKHENIPMIHVSFLSKFELFMEIVPIDEQSTFLHVQTPKDIKMSVQFGSHVKR
jgi:hypothetical protein